MFYADAHTHKEQFKENFTSFYTLGIHPWEVFKWSDSSFQDFEKKIFEVLPDPFFLGIGEFGLDYSDSHKHSKKEQEFFLKKQVSLIEKIASIRKILIVFHVVGPQAFEEIKNCIFKKISPELPILFHAFQGNCSQLQQLLKREQTFFSFGPRELTRKFGFLEKIIPPNRCFLETDDQALSIEEVYSMAIKLFPQHFSFSQQYENIQKFLAPVCSSICFPMKSDILF